MICYWLLNPLSYYRNNIWLLSSIKMTGKIIRPAPAEIEYRNLGRNMRFLITDQPQVRREEPR